MSHAVAYSVSTIDIPYKLAFLWAVGRTLNHAFSDGFGGHSRLQARPCGRVALWPALEKRHGPDRSGPLSLTAAGHSGLVPSMKAVACSTAFLKASLRNLTFSSCPDSR